MAAWASHCFLVLWAALLGRTAGLAANRNASADERPTRRGAGRHDLPNLRKRGHRWAKTGGNETKTEEIRQWMQEAVKADRDLEEETRDTENDFFNYEPEEETTTPAPPAENDDKDLQMLEAVLAKFDPDNETAAAQADAPTDAKGTAEDEAPRPASLLQKGAAPGPDDAPAMPRLERMTNAELHEGMAKMDEEMKKIMEDFESVMKEAVDAQEQLDEATRVLGSLGGDGQDADSSPAGTSRAASLPAAAAAALFRVGRRERPAAPQPSEELPTGELGEQEPEKDDEDIANLMRELREVGPSAGEEETTEDLAPPTDELSRLSQAHMSAAELMAAIDEKDRQMDTLMQDYQNVMEETEQEQKQMEKAYRKMAKQRAASAKSRTLGQDVKPKMEERQEDTALEDFDEEAALAEIEEKANAAFQVDMQKHTSVTSAASV